MQSALTVASSGTKIYVAKGTYKPTQGIDVDENGSTEVREVTFQIPSGIEVYGGFAGTENSFTQSNLDARDFTNNETILSGDIGTQNNNSDNAYHVVYTKNVSSSTLMDGFSIILGNANGTLNNDGGGWYNISDGTNSISNPKLENIDFESNTAHANGGGMYNESDKGTSNPTLTDCNFINNFTNNEGAGMYNYSLFGGTSNPSLTNCNFNNNESNFRPLGLYQQKRVLFFKFYF